jgi:hypothetical protein
MMCCIALLAVAPSAQAQSDDSGWFEGSDEPSYWSGAGPEQDSPYAAEGEPPAAPDDPPPGDSAEEQARNERAVQEFSPHLAPYGVWVDDSTYGRVWVPNARSVGASFSPYVTGGHWELTVNDDWLWVSDYPFGWVAFHYGHWVWLPTAHWGWVPGYRWAPAWVDFRVASPGVAYVGWGPAPPRYIWRNGVFVSFSTAVSVPYVFCPSASVFSVSVNRYVVRDRYRVRELSRSTRVYRERRVHGGVAVRAPSWREARIPERDLPRRRVIGRPQSVSQRSTFERRTLSSPSARRSGDRYRSNAAAGRSGPSYLRPNDRGRDNFQRREGGPTWSAPNRGQARPPARGTPGYNRSFDRSPAQRGYTQPARRGYTQPAQRNYTQFQRGASRNYSAPPSIAPRVDDRYRATRRYEGNARANDNVARPPPAAFQRRASSGSGRTMTAPRRPARDSGDHGSSRARPSRTREPSRH